MEGKNIILSFSFSPYSTFTCLISTYTCCLSLPVYHFLSAYLFTTFCPTEEERKCVSPKMAVGTKGSEIIGVSRDRQAGRERDRQTGSKQEEKRDRTMEKGEDGQLTVWGVT